MSPQRVVLAEYFTTDDVTFLFGACAEWSEPKVAKIERSLTEIRRNVSRSLGLEDVKDALASAPSRAAERDLDVDEFQQRFAPFVEPILEWAAPGDYLCIVPHDALHYLPLHAVKTEGSYLIERNPIVYSPSASVLKYCQANRKGRRERALVFGDSDAEFPLPFAREEARQVATMFGTQPFVGQEARKSLLKETLDTSWEEIDILHLACHGVFHPHQATKSGILMAPERDEGPPRAPETTLRRLPLERFLTAEEIFGMRINADVVTLSACESGVNQIGSGDELFGLMRALIYAGTPSVVMSLWPVDEISSSILMRAFYTALRQGKTKAEALQAAQLTVKGLTAAEAITHCEIAAQNLKGSDPSHYRERLQQNIAGLHYRAGNYLAAREIYENLQGHLDPADKNYMRLAASITRCNRALAQRKSPDIEKHVFRRPHYWAPFILVGDWK